MEDSVQIKEAKISDSDQIRSVHLQAFDESEARIVADFAANLFEDESQHEIISLVAVQDDMIVGHIAFSPVYLESSGEYFAYLLGPLGITPQNQKKGIGSTLVKHGLEIIADKDSFIVFVYGDPKYYSRFGFEPGLAKNFLPQYTLQYPFGWLALKINSSAFPEGGKIRCVDALNDPDLW